ncbi:hypothetical protein [Pedobacter frigoris]|uniref:Uncharacterized protein n=1 Tax=Pedobacter frigoris TaxID=2571272 RepID=A0A4U1CLF6_9SPHI|nr:hypothetical protein [Pedobacter frigoris]TKC08637.1 hypothetical protein FA047_00620 [Pedobacter frigoris]
MQTRIVFIWMSILCFAGVTRSYAQCTGINMDGAYIGSPIYNSFDTYEDIQAGESFIDFITLQFGIPYNSNCPGWKLKVRALTNFTNGSATIDAQYVSLRFNRVTTGSPSAAAMGVSTAAIPLSTSDVTLINSNAPFMAPPDYNAVHKYDMLVQGGNHLMVGSGTYSATLVFSLYNSSNVLVSTKNLTASFTVFYSNSCTGVGLSSYFSNAYSFTTYAQQMAGATMTDAATIQYNPNGATCRGWSLKVRASGNFVNGGNSVAPQYVSIRFNRVNSGSPTAGAIGATNTLVPLSTSDANVINPSNASFNGGTEHKFDLVIQGGNHLVLPNGTYTTNLIFSLYNQANQLISTTTVAVNFQINSTTNSYTLVLQNSANQVDMNLTTPAAIAAGVSVVKSLGLKVTGYSAYQVVVKTSGANLVSGTSSNTIPVAAINLEVTKATTTSGGITCYTRPLSIVDQYFVTNPLSDYTQQVVEFNLRYFTTPGDSRFSGSSGTFTTNVLFVAIPM